MALTKCRECGGEVSTLAQACPKCGAPVGAST
jgi:rRNA maturation protein Nop10